MTRRTHPSSEKRASLDVPEGRRNIMRAIRGSETKPEKRVRSLLHSYGYRFRKNLSGLPGRPDVAFTRKQKAIFVHGCFWHSHDGCRNAAVPRTRGDYWRAKLDATVARDERNIAALSELGWKTLVVWECEIPDEGGIVRALIRLLGSPSERGMA